MNKSILSADSTVAQALEIGPGIPSRLTARHTSCVGCYLTRFCTLRDTARYYGFALGPFMAELRQATADIIVSPGGTNA